MLGWKGSTYTFALFSFCTFKYNFLWLLRFHIIPFWFPCFFFLFIPVKDDYGRRRNENRVHARNICVQRRKLFTAIRHKGFSSEGFLREASLRTGRLVISNRRLSSDAHPCITLLSRILLLLRWEKAFRLIIYQIISPPSELNYLWVCHKYDHWCILTICIKFPN